MRLTMTQGFTAIQWLAFVIKDLLELYPEVDIVVQHVKLLPVLLESCMVLI